LKLHIPDDQEGTIISATADKALMTREESVYEFVDYVLQDKGAWNWASDGNYKDGYIYFNGDSTCEL
jgi:hypothetical protein